MNRKEIFLEQFTVCYNENSWFVALKNALEGLTAEQASWKETDGTNSIREIVNHLVFYHERWLNRFKGIEVPPAEGINDMTFENADEECWESTVKRLNANLSEWYKMLEESDESKFGQPAYKEADTPWWSVLINLTTHMAYHTGQIIHIRKQQGIWDPKQGVH
ncbi:DinB family protein [Fictibacillus gelatini]|uniref:DinB family protein n=1 Tax=Fictibacillus gelatini TaxID=225985 RepID=UPI000428298E|nr:DinB family protein [Fictibacillus gelatini]